MKNKSILIVLFLLSVWISAKAQVNYVSGNKDAITLRTIGIGSNKNEAVVSAEKNVFYVLFFRGVPESDQKQPLIEGKESEALQKNKAFFDNFFKDRYQTFIISEIANTPPTKQKGGTKSISLDISVNLIALKKELEDNEIIRKFGF